MKCKHCGGRVQRSHFAGSWSHPWIHVTANGDRLSTYCELVQAEPAGASEAGGGQ